MRKILLMIIALCLPQVSFADETGLTGATAFSISAVWTNGDSVLAASGSDNERAIHAAFGTTNALRLTNYGFTIPTSATITLITVSIEGHGTANVQSRRVVEGQLTKDGTTGIGDKPLKTLSKDADATGNFVPATNILWGLSWTAAELNSSNFGVILTKNINSSDPIRIDYLQVNVVYSIGGVTRRRRIIIMGDASTDLPQDTLQIIDAEIAR